MNLYQTLAVTALKIGRRNVLTNVYGLARSILAFGTLITFLFNSPTTLFGNVPYHYNALSTSEISRISIFYLLPGHLSELRYASIAILLLVISGWRPRITGVLHWYITYSLFTSCDFFDGGDQIASILALFLIPFCMLDPRTWAWQASGWSNAKSHQPYINIFLNAFYFIIRLQVCIIYFHAGVAKLKVDQWIDGTATYYWFTNNAFGASYWFKPFIVYLFSKALIVVLFTWGTMIFEIILAMSFMMKRNSRNWKLLLILGCLFHFGIVIIHGLISFFFTMVAALILYLWPLWRSFHLKKRYVRNLENWRNISTLLHQ